MRLFDTPSLVESNSPKFDQISDIEEQSEEEDNTFSGSEHKDENEHIEKVLEIVDLFHIPKITQNQIMLQAFPFLNKFCPPARIAKKLEKINNFQQEPDESLFCAWERFKELWMKCPQLYLTDMQEVILFYNGLDVPTRQILDSKGVIPSKTDADAKVAIQEMVEFSQKWHNGTSSRSKMYAAQVGCELCKGPYYTKIVHKRKKEKTLEEAYYTQFGAPYQSKGQYRAAGPGFYQRNNENSSYPDRRPSLEESLTKFMAESAKRHEENSNIIKEIRASTDVAIRNQGALIKTLDIQIGQTSKVLQERGFGSLPSSTKTNPRDQVKSISTTKADFSEICHIGCGLYTVSGMHHRSIISEPVPFPRRLQNFGCDEWREALDVKIIEAYDHTLPQKEKDPGSFTLPYFFHNICFGKAFVDLGASVSVMPFSTYTNLGLGILSHTRLTIELADQTIKQPRGLTIIEDDDVTKDVVLGMKFFKKYALCQMITKKFTFGDKCKRINDDE
ncbi:hypothetical protein Tco_0939613 [Tanacetum coccineum]|uniref:Retrotransposon gag domain-containing protein n=1 Tax=Tanacetum coccineum TaxID=301880 RepID=A0ABQ5DN48_9ASTR